MRKRFVQLFVPLMLLTSTIGVRAGAIEESAIDLGQAVFTALERKAIQNYYQQRRVNDEHEREHKHPKKAASNKRSKGGEKPAKGLPPGIALKVERGGTLPPGIARKDLPLELESQLPPRIRYRRMELDTQVVLIDIASDIIVDVIDKVF